MIILVKLLVGDLVFNVISAYAMLLFRMQHRKRTKLSMQHFTGSILQVMYLYFPKGGRIYIMSKTNTGSNSNEYY
jgi:hypothetical protein